MGYNGMINYSTNSTCIEISGTTAPVQLLPTGYNSRFKAVFQYFGGSTSNHLYVGFHENITSTDAAAVAISEGLQVEVPMYQGIIYGVATSSGVVFVQEQIM